MILREMNETDIPFIYSSYLKSLRPYKSYITNDVYYTMEHRRVEHCLLNSITMVLVDPVDQNKIIGYAIAEVVPDVHVILHYVYVKKRHREKGLANLLIQTILDNIDGTLPRSCSNYTSSFINIQNKFNFIYNPYTFDNQLGV